MVNKTFKNKDSSKTEIHSVEYDEEELIGPCSNNIAFDVIQILISKLQLNQKLP
jgi:hypothetical protein